MKQVVITKAIEKAIQRTPYRSTDGQGGNAKVIVKLFYPRGNNAFLITEGGHSDGEKWNGDTVYGWCKHDGGEFEAGCFSLRELLETKAEIKWSFGTCSVGIERDTSVDVKKETVLEVIGKMGCAAPDCLCKPEDQIKKVEKSDGYTIASVKPGEKPVVIAEVTHTDEAEKPTEETAKQEPEKKPHVKGLNFNDKKKDIGAWDPETWRKLRDHNNHSEAQFMVATWAATNATAERDEFALLMDDYAYVCNEGHDEMTADLVDFRHELFDELRDRVKRVYGNGKWAECATCL